MLMANVFIKELPLEKVHGFIKKPCHVTVAGSLIFNRQLTCVSAESESVADANVKASRTVVGVGQRSTVQSLSSTTVVGDLCDRGI